VLQAHARNLVAASIVLRLAVAVVRFGAPCWKRRSVPGYAHEAGLEPGFRPDLSSGAITGRAPMHLRPVAATRAGSAALSARRGLTRCGALGQGPTLT